ncbi:MAG: dehydrogenase [Hyphomicrobiales bacterium]|nr:dehydrogenase [Hyphomicrobiales bacterium]
MAACVASSPSVDPPKPQLASPPVELTRACAGPAELPDRALKGHEVERYWFRDRASLAVCKRRHGGLVRFYLKRDRGLTGQ